MPGLIEWLKMGGYASYVWSAYGLGVIVLGWNVIMAKRKHQKVVRLEK